MGEVVPHWLDKQADLLPDQIAVEGPDGISLSFLQLKNRSRSYAKKLASSDVKAGDHVALLSSNSVEMVVALHALSYLGAVAVLLNTRLSVPEMAYQLQDAQISRLLSYPAGQEVAKAAVGQTGKDLPVCLFSEVDDYGEADIQLAEELFLDDLFTIIYTSGTTGFPKGVRQTYANHWWSAVASALNLGLNEEDKWLAVLPLFHVGGLSILLKSVIYGMPVHLLPRFNVNQVHRAIMEDGITIVSVVAVMLKQLTEKLADNSYPEGFRCMLLGGGPASRSLLEKAKQLQIPVFQTYGMTETSSQIATLNPQYALTRLGSAGKSLFPARLRIRKNGEAAAPFETGEIFVKGPMVTKGYYHNELANEQAFQKGWLATGDLGYLDEDGFLYVVDRRKDLIISGGENIYPAEIEGVLEAMPEIREAGVAGVEDDQWGQVPAAFIVTKEKDLATEVVLAYCSRHLASYKVPKQVFFVKELPRNASRKLMRHQLAEWGKEEH